MLVMRAVFKICRNESQPGLQPSRKAGYAPAGAAHLNSKL